MYFALKERFLRSENFDHKDLFKAIKQLLHTLALMPINCKINQTCRELIELLLNYIITYEFASDRPNFRFGRTSAELSDKE